MSALMLVLMPEHRLICPISKNSSPDAHGDFPGLGFIDERQVNWTDRGSLLTAVRAEHFEPIEK